MPSFLRCAQLFAFLTGFAPLTGVQAQVVSGTQDFSITVESEPVALTADLWGPETAISSGEESTANLQGLYDGNDVDYPYSNIMGASAVELRFAQPVMTNGAYISARNTHATYTATASVEAYVNGVWQYVGARGFSSTGGSTSSFNGAIPFASGAVTASRFRITGTGLGNILLREFRMSQDGKAPMTPSWTTAAGYVGKTGETVSLAAIARNSHSMPPLHYALAPGQTLPNGTTLSSNGVLSIGTVSTDVHDVTLRVSDGASGPFVERSFHLTPASPSSLSVTPSIVTVNGVGSVASLNALYNGDLSTNVYSTISGTSAPVLEFVNPVLASGVFISARNSSSTASATASIEAWVNGAWRQVDSLVFSNTAGTTSTQSAYRGFGSGAVSAAKFRIIGNTGTLALREFRIGHEGAAPLITP